VSTLSHYAADKEWGYGIAFKLSSSKAIAPAEATEMAREAMKELAEEAVRRGAIMIGHIKCILKASGGYVKADTIGAKYGVYVESKLTEPVREGVLVVNSIVVGLSKDENVELTRSLTKKVAERYGFNVTILETKT
jgi:predicted metal-dependent phosphotriesterase family hydrolase